MDHAVKVRVENHNQEIQADKGDNLLAVLQKAGVNIASPCGGSGICRKCRVCVDGEWKLACQVSVEKDCMVTTSEQSDRMVISEKGTGLSFTVTERPGYGIAVDIGTTTVVVYLLDLHDGRIVETLSEANAQKIFGADVIARIDHSNKNGTEPVSGAIRDQLNRIIRNVLEKSGVKTPAIMAVAGNTVMLHFLAGLDPAGIAVAPFTPVSLFGDLHNARDIGLDFDCKAYLCPCVAGYVGGDITAGILSSGAYQEKELCLFVDLGTNGEMALGDENGFLCCATAAGPAFEGACIECGSPALPGAVSKAWMENGIFCCETAGKAPVTSICGSGLVDVTACLLEMGAVDETGRMLDEDEAEEECEGAEHWIDRLEETDDGIRFWLNEEKTVWISSKDIRQVQLAKAAVAAGIQTLLFEAGKKVKDIRKVFLAGGFGNYISKEGAVVIGLLPKECEDRIIVTGNSAGAGAVDWVISDNAREELERLKDKCRYLELSCSAKFQEYYVDEMFFEVE